MLLLKKTNVSTSVRSACFGLLAALLFGSASEALKADALRISEDEGRKSIVAKVVPTPPPITKQAHTAGRVLVDPTVGEDGSVEKADVVSGNPILRGAAVRAGKGWMFKPFQGTDGKPSKAVVPVSFDFGASIRWSGVL
jgi:TonB family protein